MLVIRFLCKNETLIVFHNMQLYALFAIQRCHFFSSTCFT